MDKMIAFIGTGYMGSAMIKATCKEIDPKNIIITDSLQTKATELADEVGCQTAESNAHAVEKADGIMLCVKPQVMSSVIKEIAPILRIGYDAGKPKMLYSIAAGTKIETLREYLEMPDYPIIRIIPNTPCHIGKGLVLLARDETVSDEALFEIKQMLSGCGNTQELSENLFDQATVSASCSPAYVYMFIEAMADAGVSTGLSRAQAQAFAANAVYGAAAMVMETDLHPGVLKDMVCSPGGSTIAGVAELEANSFRSAIIKAATASYKKTTELGIKSQRYVDTKSEREA